MRLLVGLLALGLLATQASAQLAGDDACSQANPCAIDLDVDELGFMLDPTWNGTQGDWYLITVANWDVVPHTVSVAGIDVVAYPWDSELVDDEGRSTSAPFEAFPGQHVILDDVSGDTGTFSVMAADTPTAFDGIGEEVGKAAAEAVDVPSPGWLGLVALGGVALLRRR